MLIHSVSPAHMLIEQPPGPSLVCRALGSETLEGIETPQGFQISRVYSTNPASYLKAEYSPGSYYGK